MQKGSKEWKMSINSQRPVILIVDDTPENIQVMANILSKEGYHISPALSGHEALERIKMFSPDLVLLDLIMPGMSGFEVLETMRQQYSSTPVIIVTTETNPDVAAECMKKGAIDYLTKPIDTLRTITVVKNALKARYLERMSMQSSRANVKAEYEIVRDFIAVDPQSKNTVMEAQTMSCRETTILITGASGTGKTLLARLISRIRGGGETFDCAARTDFQSFLNSEPGWATVLENADILSSQEHMLLQNYMNEKSKLILTVNGNIDESLTTEGFWSNLYFNQACAHLHLPPLPARGEDILPLFDYFLTKAAEERGIDKPAYPVEALVTLKSFDFPDNVTDLRSIAYRSIGQVRDGKIPVEYFRNLSAESQQPCLPSSFSLFQRN